MIFYSIHKIIRTVVSPTLKQAKLSMLLLLLVVSFQSFSQIKFVGGILENNENWTSDTTYVVFQDLVIPDGVLLSIHEGVLVKVNYGMGIIADSGTIRVSGNELDSVRFIPNHSNPGQMWKWEGIVIKNANAENENYIRYAQIIDAETAIKLEDSRNVTIENCNITNCQNLGINVINSSSWSWVRLQLEPGGLKTPSLLSISLANVLRVF